MSSHKKSSGAKSSGKKSPRKIDLNDTKHDKISDKIYTTKEIETSITLLGSPEESVVLEALVFLSKYSELQANNINHLHTSGILPRLFLLFDQNVCILRVSLRFLAKMLEVNADIIDIHDEKFDEGVQKICEFYKEHKDAYVKEYCSEILTKYAKHGRGEVLLKVEKIVEVILKTIKISESDNTTLLNSLELLFSLIEIEEVREGLAAETALDFEVLSRKMEEGQDYFSLILSIFEKITYFCVKDLGAQLREHGLVESMITWLLDEEKKDYHHKILKIILHCMQSEETNHYFVESLEYLRLCNWAKTCREEYLVAVSSIFQKLSEIDEIRQMIFDLSVEETILSFLRSEDKVVLNQTCLAVSNMSTHKYCCETMVTPVVIRRILGILQRQGDEEDVHNELALRTLHDLAKRDTRVPYMIHEYEGIPILLSYLKLGPATLSTISYQRLLEIANMIAGNRHLKKPLLSQDLYDILSEQLHSENDEIFVRCLEIGFNCLDDEMFREHFLMNNVCEAIVDRLSSSESLDVIRTISVFLYRSFMYDDLAMAFIHKKLLLVLKKLSEWIRVKVPLLDSIVVLIYDRCLPVKFYEKRRLEVIDKLSDRFYVLTEPWSGEFFPFLEVLELRKISTKYTIYVVNYGNSDSSDSLIEECCTGLEDQASLACSIKYGRVSPDPYLTRYIYQARKLMAEAKTMADKVKVLAELVDRNLCGPTEGCGEPEKMHNFKLHVQCLKHKLGTNIIPIGYLRIGFHRERALLFKALADQVQVPSGLVKGQGELYWNEVALVYEEGQKTFLRMCVVDLMRNVGALMALGSRDCNAYCDNK